MSKYDDIFIVALNVYVILISQVVNISHLDSEKIIDGLGFMLALYVGNRLMQKVSKADFMKKFVREDVRR